MNPTTTCSRCGLFHPSTSHCLSVTLSTKPRSSDLAAGSLHAGRYRIKRLLHRGGMSTIYLAEDTKMQGRQIALKELRLPDGASEIETREAESWFARESAMLSMLRHPLIPTFYSVFREGDRSYIAQEYVPGENLDEVVNRQGPIDPIAVATWAISLCRLLEYLHGLPEPVVFRDLKPANVLLRATWSTPERRLAVVDFGIARSFQNDAVGTVIGTPGYAPPEQYQGLATPRSDVYALGATLHRLLTGFDPTHGTPFTFPQVRDLAPNVPDDLAIVVRRATALNPADRYPDAAEMRAALQAAIPVVDRPVARTRRLLAQSPQRAMLGVAALLIVPLLLSQMLLRAATGAPYYYQGQSDVYSPPLSAYQQPGMIDPSAQSRTTIGPPNSDGSRYPQCSLTVAQYTRPRTDFTCGADNAVWFIDAPNNELDRVLPDGSVSQFAIPAPAMVMNTITASPGGSPGADSLWLTGTSNAVIYVPFNGLLQVRHIGASGPVISIGTTQDGSLRFVQPSDHVTGVVLTDGRVLRATTTTKTIVAPSLSVN
jgi:serine/threonine protein kinase